MNQDREVEVSPATIEAGAVALSQWHPEFESLKNAAERVYLAMVYAGSPKPQAPEHNDSHS